MAQNFCSFCCCSFCSPEQSSQQQREQQPPISSSSPPPQQSITAHSSTSPPLEEPTPNMTDFRNFLHKFNDISQIDILISFLGELVKIASGEKSHGGPNSAVATSHINDGQALLEMLDKRFGKIQLAQNSANNTSAEMQNVLMEVLKGSEKIPQVGIALCMLGFALERFIKMPENTGECLNVLKRMHDLGNRIVRSNVQIPEQKLNEAVRCIVEGTIMCISQLTRPNIFRFLTAQVSEKSLKDFQIKIDRLYYDIPSWTEIDKRERLTDIGDRVPKIASESQKIQRLHTNRQLGSRGHRRM